MKKYTKPVAEVKDFAVVNKIADLTSWLGGEDVVDAGVGGIEATNITSYNLNS